MESELIHYVILDPPEGFSKPMALLYERSPNDGTRVVVDSGLLDNKLGRNWWSSRLLTGRLVVRFPVPTATCPWVLRQESDTLYLHHVRAALQQQDQ